MYSTKYKNREPKETVKLIEEFFKNEGYIIKIKEFQKTDINSYYVRIFLYYDDYIVLKSNGKGMSEEFCLASAYAELYERYCNFANYLLNYGLFKEIIKNNFNNKGYFLDKDEKVVEKYENNLDYSYQEWFKSYFLDLEDGNKFLKAFNDNMPTITIPFKNVFSDNKEYFDLRLCHLINTSTGMAAGNTENEALIQGISEIYERIGFNDIMMKPQETYYELDLKNMELPQALVNIINFLDSQKNFDFKCYDLGYNFGYPVLLGILLDKKGLKIYPTLGSFPDFNIALERILTELYQGTCSFNSYNTLEGVNSLIISNPQVPFDYNISKFIMFGPGGASYKTSRYFNEDLLKEKKITHTTKFSSAFINNTFENNEENILQFYKQIANKLNMNFYFRNNSLSKEIHSVFIYTTTPIWTTKNAGAKCVTNQKEQIEFYSDYKQFCNEILDNINSNKYKQLNEMPLSIHNKMGGSNIVDANYLYHLTYSNPLTPESFHSVNDYIYIRIFNCIKFEKDTDKMYKKILNLSTGSCIYHIIRKYATIYTYKQIYKSNETLYNYFKEIGFNDIELIEIENIENRQFIFNQLQKAAQESWELPWVKAIIRMKI